MKNSTVQKSLVGVLATLAFVACTPSAKQLKEAVEKDPSIVFAAIEKDPQKFIEVVNKAAREAQEKGAESAQKEEQTKRDEEFKNPLKPVIEDGRPIEGPKDAKITIVEYSDFECPYCAQGYKTLEEVLKAYPNQIRFVFKNLPLEFHPKALPTAKYFMAVAKQGSDKAYKFHDYVFENRAKLISDGEKFMKEAAKHAGADMKKVEKDVNDPAIMAQIEKDTAEAKSFGISGTPGFVINGVSLKGAYPFADFKAIIDRHLASAGGTPAPAADAAAPAAAEPEKKTE